MCRPSKIDVSTFGDRCVDLRRSMCRPSEIDVLTFDDRWSMCRPSKTDGRCEIRLLYLLKTLILYINCMRITPRVCTSVLSLCIERLFILHICVSICGPYICAVSLVCANESHAVFHGPVVCAVKT